MSSLRETYKIREFQQARQALDGYYSALNTLARLIKAHASQEQVDEQGHAIKEARDRLGRAIERLGFTVTSEGLQDGNVEGGAR